MTFANAHAVDTTATLPGVGEYVLRLTATDTVFTVSDDVKVTVHEEQAPVLSVADVSVAEGQEGTTGAVVTFTLSKPWTQPVTADYKTADGTATAGCATICTVFGSIRFELGRPASRRWCRSWRADSGSGRDRLRQGRERQRRDARAPTQSTLTILNDDVANAPPPPSWAARPRTLDGIVLRPLTWTSTDPDAGGTLSPRRPPRDLVP